MCDTLTKMIVNLLGFIKKPRRCYIIVSDYGKDKYGNYIAIINKSKLYINVYDIEGNENIVVNSGTISFEMEPEDRCEIRYISTTKISFFQIRIRIKDVDGYKSTVIITNNNNKVSIDSSLKSTFIYIFKKQYRKLKMKITCQN